VVLSNALKDTEKADLITDKLSAQLDNLPAGIKKTIVDATDEAIKGTKDPATITKLDDFKAKFT